MVVKTVFDKSTEALTMVGCALAGAFYNLSPEVAAATIGIAKIKDCLANNPKSIGLEDMSGITNVREKVKATHELNIKKHGGEREKEYQVWLGVADEVLASSLEDFDLDHKDLTQKTKDLGGFEPAAIHIVMAHLGTKRVDLFGSDKTNMASHIYASDVVTACIEAAAAQQDYFARLQLNLLSDIAGGVKDLKIEQEEMKALLKQVLAEKHIASTSDLASDSFFEELAKAHKTPLNEVLGLVSGVLDQNIDPRNFGQMLDMAKAALEKVKTDYERLSRLANEAPEIKPFLDKARAALENQDAIDLKEAQAELRAARREYDKRVIKRFNEEQENSAQMIVLEAQLAQAQSNIDDAAALYDEAIAKVAHNTELFQDYMWDKGALLYGFGQLSPEPDLLIQSAKAWEELLEISPKDRNPEYWAKLKGWQGLIAQTLGERRAGDKDLLLAVDYYRAALSVFTQKDHTDDWATTQNNLGLVLGALGDRSSDDALLHEAVAAYRSALEEWTQDRVPLYWATTQNNLGNALQTLGDRSSDVALLHDAVSAYRSALEEWTQDRVPLYWATTQNNLGNALQTLGDRSSDDALLHDAVSAYRSALEVRTQDRVPLDWATTQNNLGAVLQVLGARSSDDALLHEAVSAYRSALEERTQDRVPLDWATTQNNLGAVLQVLGARSSDDALLQDAIAAYHAALTERREDNAPYYHQQTMENLAIAEKTLTEIRANNNK